MQATSDDSSVNDEKQYPRAVFEAILAGFGEHSLYRESFDCRDEGVWIRDVKSLDSEDSELSWHPLCELTGPDIPDPLEAPWLRFPFTAKELAAFMVYGRGYAIREKYGSWKFGPDANALALLPPRAARAAEALAAAYEAYRRAFKSVPELDQSLEQIALVSNKAYDYAREEAMTNEGLRSSELSSAEYTKRIGRVNESVKDLELKFSEARDAADRATREWRRALVQNLLKPSPPPQAIETAEARQKRRLDDLRAFGGEWINRDGKWGAKDRSTGAFERLVAQEKSNNAKSSSEKSVRNDLSKAAETEREARRAGSLYLGLVSK